MIPGLNKALAASLDPKDARYQEYCPDSPTKKCYGTIPAGGGFYSLPIEIEQIDQWNKNKDVFSHYFKWVRGDDGKLIAELRVDSRNYYTPVTPNFYAGLQLNIPIGPYYSGITLSNPSFTPNSQTIDHASLEFRAVVCPNQSEKYFLTMHYYSDGWSLSKHNGYSLAFNYAFSWNTDQVPFLFEPALISQGQIMRKLGYSEEESRIYDATIAIDSHRYGMLPLPSNNSAITVSCTKDINSIPFTKIKFDVQKFLSLLEKKNIIYPVNNYQYAGGIIAGVELWGRANVVIQVKNHKMESEPEVFQKSISEGKFKMPDNSLWYSNGTWGVCQYINLVHSGVSSVQEINRTVNEIPPNLSVGWCPGADSLNLF